MYSAIFIFIIIGSIVICHFIAKARGANTTYWGIMGGIFGPFAIPFVFLSKPQSNKKKIFK
jgi:hypothetical protein